MKKIFTIIICSLFIMLTVLTIPRKSNAGYYRDYRIYYCIDKGRVNNYGEKKDVLMDIK